MAGAGCHWLAMYVHVAMGEEASAASALLSQVVCVERHANETGGVVLYCNLLSSVGHLRLTGLNHLSHAYGERETFCNEFTRQMPFFI